MNFEAPVRVACLLYIRWHAQVPLYPGPLKFPHFTVGLAGEHAVLSLEVNIWMPTSALGVQSSGDVESEG